MLRFQALSAELIPSIEHWFDDPDTIRFLGGRSWIRRELRLLAELPGVDFRGHVTVGRDAWVACDAHGPVGFIDVERYDDGTAGLAIVVDPSRRCRGIGSAVLAEVWRRPELDGVHTLFGGVEQDNVASQRCFRAAGFTLASSPDDEGMLRATSIGRATSGAQTTGCGV
jgi:ribosomal protein S18 acetylase RimI-like enzyme